MKLQGIPVAGNERVSPFTPATSGKYYVPSIYVGAWNPPAKKAKIIDIVYSVKIPNNTLLSIFRRAGTPSTTKNLKKLIICFQDFLAIIKNCFPKIFHKSLHLRKTFRSIKGGCPPPLDIVYGKNFGTTSKISKPESFKTSAIELSEIGM
ncbi:MAG: hypothetical protein IPI71_10070 [Methanolinea sp.]|nr:MAG: hypothetical protein IPI71_10070 [Methanolinea sp.]